MGSTLKSSQKAAVVAKKAIIIEAAIIPISHLMCPSNSIPVCVYLC
jgi:hypothetical protein